MWRIKSDTTKKLYRVACNGIVIDTRDNYHKSFQDAEKYLNTLSKYLYNEYTIVQTYISETVWEEYVAN